MNEQTLEQYWNDLPIGRENAIAYPTLCVMWGRDERTVRGILHELSLYDNLDNFVLIRSGKRKGFYKTDDEEEIAAYRRECLSKGKSIFAPVRKCNRILKQGGGQVDMFNNLRTTRERWGLKQKDVCNVMRHYDRYFDVSLLSKMENGACLPTPYQLSKLAEIYGCMPSELVAIDLPSAEYIDAN